MRGTITAVAIVLQVLDGWLFIRHPLLFSPSSLHPRVCACSLKVKLHARPPPSRVHACPHAQEKAMACVAAPALRHTFKTPRTMRAVTFAGRVATCA